MLYFDCFSGISGDMLLSSLLDLGVPEAYLHDSVAALKLSVELNINKNDYLGIGATGFHVAASNPSFRHYHDIVEVISTSTLSPSIIDRSIQVIDKLAWAESHVHGVDIDKLHFHEIGAVDTIVDVVGVFCCLEYLGETECYCSYLPWSGGFVDISHGRYPLPAPATAWLLRGVPCYGSTAGLELITPTGAAIITSIVSHFGPLPYCIPENIGYGAGSYQRADQVPNLLRVVKANMITNQSENFEGIALVETEVDDFNPEVFSHLFKLYTNHPDVKDFYTTPIIMKKNRPGFLLTVVTTLPAANTIAASLITETPSLGARISLHQRMIVNRRSESINTPWGVVRVKIAELPSGKKRIKAEYEDCEQLAQQHGIPLIEMMAVINRLIANNYSLE